MTSQVSAAHLINATTPAATVHSEATRLATIADEAARACRESPTPTNNAALRAALDAAWPYTHASGMLRANGL